MIATYLDSILFPMSRTHRFHLKKLFYGFKQNGLFCSKIRYGFPIKKLGESDYVYVTSHFWTDPRLYFFRKLILKYLIYLIKSSKSKFILWNFHDISIENILKDIPSSKYLHIGEDFDPTNDKNEEHVKKFRENNKVHLLKYSSSRLPNKISSCFLNTKKFDLTYSGTLYKKSWILELQKKYDCNFLIYPPKINENKRIKNFINGQINLCFHHDDSIRKGIITERFSESISMGGIVVHDSPKIHKLFGHCPSIFFVNNINQLLDTIEKILNLDQLTLNELRSQSFKLWQLSNLNYQKQVELIIGAFSE